MSKVSFFYLRHQPNKLVEHLHPYACVALRKTDEKDTYRVSLYIHDPRKGPFVKVHARNCAVGRLDSSLSYSDMALHSESYACGAILQKFCHRFSRYGYDIYAARQKNMTALLGALSELQDKKEMKAS